MRLSYMIEHHADDRCRRSEGQRRGARASSDGSGGSVLTPCGMLRRLSLCFGAGRRSHSRARISITSSDKPSRLASAKVLAPNLGASNGANDWDQASGVITIPAVCRSAHPVCVSPPDTAKNGAGPATASHP